MAFQHHVNELLQENGEFVDAQALTQDGAWVRYGGPDAAPVVTDGPFAEAKEVVAGFTIIEVASKEEAIEWVKKWPHAREDGDFDLELRQVFAPEDFGEEFTPELREREERMRAEAERNAARG